MTLFGNKCRIESARLKGWDYASTGWYFVTICTREGECVFGNIIDGAMHLSGIGKIVAEEWQKTETIRPDVGLDQWIVMPNHVHGIIVIEHALVETPRRGVSTTKSLLKPHSLGSIIGQFKSVCTKRIRVAGYPSFFCQERFYDHIIRSEHTLAKIREYIIANPSKWDSNGNNAVNLWI